LLFAVQLNLPQHDLLPLFFRALQKVGEPSKFNLNGN